MSTKFFTNKDGNTLINKLEGIFKHNPIAYFDVLVGYFYASGYFALRPHLENVGQVRILVGIDADKLARKYYNKGYRPQISHEDIEEAISSFLEMDFNEAKYDKGTEQGIRQFVDDVISRKVLIKAHPNRRLHAKIYIFRPENFNEHQSGSVITGSSNLTSQGLGVKEQISNYEFNVLLNDYSDVKFASDEFEELWAESIPLSNEVFEKAKKRTFLQEISPRQLYIKFLLEYFGDDDDAGMRCEWPPGYLKLSYQEDAVKEAFAKLKTQNGLFLADVVGLGKTVVASAIARAFWQKRLYDCSILVVCPPALKKRWGETIKEFLPKACIVCETPGRLYALVGKAVDYDLVIVDEAHRFRNNSTDQYEHLQKICKTRTTSNKKKKVLLVTATPFNNRPKDLYNQATLFLDGADTLDLDKPLDQYFHDIEKRHKSIIKSSKNILKSTQKLYEEVRTDVVEKITIRRTRTDLEDIPRYKEDLEKRGISFPKVNLEKIYYILPEEMERLYDETIEVISGSGDKEGALLYMRYQILNHLQEQVKKQYKTAASISKQLVGIMKTLLLKRMDSSFDAFLATVKTFVSSAEAMIKMIENDKIYIAHDRKLVGLILDEEEDKIIEHLEKINQRSEPVTAEDLSDDFIEGVKSDYKILTHMHNSWAKAVLAGDPKFEAFYDRMQKDVISKYGFAEGKVIIFTESAITMEHVARKLREEGCKVLAVDSKSVRANEKAITDNFDANASNKSDEYQFLITTDVLAEGVNLHRARIIVNYDTPWNATKLMQRIGRINRIGTKAESIQVYNCFPTTKVESDLELKKRAIIKLQAFHSALGEDSQIYSDEEEVETFGIFDSNVAEEASATLKYWEDLREFKAANKEEYEYLRSLGPKLRNGRQNKKHVGKTLVFARTANRRSPRFYLAGPGDQALQALNFPASASMLRADSSESAIAVHSSHYKHVEAALAQFRSEQQALFDSQVNLPSKDVGVMNHLMAISKDVQNNEEYRDLLEKAINLIKARSLAKFRKRIYDFIKFKEKENKILASQAQQYEELMDIIRSELPAAVIKDESEEERGGGPTVLLSQSYD